MKRHEQKQLGEEGLSFAYISTPQIITEGSQSRGLECGADAKTVEECCLLDCSS